MVADPAATPNPVAAAAPTEPIPPIPESPLPPGLPQPGHVPPPVPEAVAHPQTQTVQVAPQTVALPQAAPAGQVQAPVQHPAGNIPLPRENLKPQAIPLPSRPAPQPDSPVLPESPVGQHPPSAPQAAPDLPEPKRPTQRAAPNRPAGLQLKPPKGAKPQGKKSKSKSTSSGNLPTVVKIAIPVLVIALLGFGAVKLWPMVQEKLGWGAPPDPPNESAKPAIPITPVSPRDDPSGFRYTDNPTGSQNSNTKPISPSPETNFEPEMDPEPERPIETVGPADPDPAVEKVEQEEQAKLAARAVLDRAIAATSVDELAELVLAPKRVRPLMDEYYAAKPPGLEATSVIYETAIPLGDGKFSNHTFFVATDKQPMRFPVAIEETADGPKLDWESFIELHDDLLGKFLDSPQSDSQTFRVVLTRSHYFGSEVPRLGSKDCFRVSTPIPGSDGYAFVDKDSKAAMACRPFEWDRVCFPIVTLKWTTPKSGKPYLEISRVVQESWRAKGAEDPNE